MDKNQGIPLPCSDHFRGNDGLAECCGCCKHPGFVLEKGFGGLTLFRRQLAKKLRGEGLSLLAFVTEFGRDPCIAEKTYQIVEASPREGDVFREQFGTRDDARL